MDLNIILAEEGSLSLFSHTSFTSIVLIFLFLMITIGIFFPIIRALDFFEK